MTLNASSNWPRNRLLLALPSRNLKQLMPELERVRCDRAQVLMDAEQPPLDHVFFPDSGVVSAGGRLFGRQHHRDGNGRKGGLQ